MADDVRQAAKPDYHEIGVSGTRLIAGILYEEQNPALQGLKAYDTFVQMRYDSTCAALLKAYSMPVMSARWYVEPASDDPKDVEKADFIHDMLWDFGSMSMDEFLRLALTMHDFGFSFLEIVYRKLVDGPWKGKVGWDKFAYRSQRTLWRWNMGEVGGRQELVSVTQLAPPYYSQIDIPRNKLLLFCHDKEGDNYSGRSLLRPCYKNWYIRDQLYRIQAVGLERCYMGVPVARLPKGYSDELKQLALQVITGMRTDDNVGITIPEELLLEVLHTELTGGAEMNVAIEYHDKAILLSGLAQFLKLGSGETGSFALSSDHSQLFLQALNSKANYLAEAVNLDPGIPSLITMNYADADRTAMPRLAHGDMGQRALEGLGRTLMALAQFGFLTPDDATEDKLREVLDLPPRDSQLTDKALLDLVPKVFPTDPEQFGRQHTARSAAPGAPGAAGPPATNGAKGPPSPPGGGAEPGATEVDQSGKASNTGKLAASEWELLASQRQMRRPRGRLDDGTRRRIELTEAFADHMGDLRRGIGRKPERPSVTIAKNRRPYELLPFEPAVPEQLSMGLGGQQMPHGAGVTIVQPVQGVKPRPGVGQPGFGGPEGAPPPAKQSRASVVPMHRHTLARHQRNLEGFMKDAHNGAKLPGDGRLRAAEALTRLRRGDRSAARVLAEALAEAATEETRA